MSESQTPCPSRIKLKNPCTSRRIMLGYSLLTLLQSYCVNERPKEQPRQQEGSESEQETRPAKRRLHGTDGKGHVEISATSQLANSEPLDMNQRLRRRGGVFRQSRYGTIPPKIRSEKVAIYLDWQCSPKIRYITMTSTGRR